jgi:hypothetical protein
MSNTKNLLNENTIRRFMKLAEIDTLSDGFVTGLVKEQLPDEAFEGEEDVEIHDGETGPPEAELDMPDEGGETAEVNITDEEAGCLTGVLQKLLSAQGEEELPGDEDVEVELGDLGPEEEGPMALSENQRRQVIHKEDLRRQAVYQEQQRRAVNYRNAVKNEVFRRVSARLQQESRKDAVADQLSERILRRIKGQSKK